MNAAVYTNSEKLTVKRVPTPEINENEVLIKVKNVGICGSDIGIYKGMHPRANPPLIMGHEISGVVEKHGHDSVYKKGDKVTINPLIYCDNCESCNTGNKHVCESLKLIGVDFNGGFSEYVKVSEDQVILLPQNMGFDNGALTEPVAVGVHSVRKSRLKVGDDVLILGGGPIGVITAICAKINGAKNIFVSEVNSLRRQMIDKMGFISLNPTANSDIEQEIVRLNKRKVDIVFEVAGVEQTITDAINSVKNSGQIVIVSVFKKPAITDLQQINFRELNLIGTRVYTDKDFIIALKLINEYPDFNKIITHTFKLQEINSGFDKMLEQADSIKIMIQVDDNS